jgi:hypothetical protein
MLAGVGMMASMISVSALHTILRAAVPTLAIIVGSIVEGYQLKAFGAHMNARFDQLIRGIDAASVKNCEER